LKPTFQTAIEWAQLENARGYHCACGCGASIKVAACHRYKGIPRYRTGHHPNRMTKEVKAIRDGGGLTSHQVAQLLGIGRTTLLRLEGVAYEKPKRVARRSIRVFTPEMVAKAKAWLADTSQVTSDEWVRQANLKARPCACGCGQLIRVLPRHRSAGIPSYSRGHNPARPSKEVKAIREAGGMTTHQVARMLGIGRSTLLRLEGVAYEKARRVARRGIRVFTPEMVAKLRAWLAARGKGLPLPAAPSPGRKG